VPRTPEEKKHTFAKKLNPLKWFAGKSKKADLSETSVLGETGASGRYSYPLPVTPIPGDRKLAERLTSEGRQAERQSNRAEAMRDYQEAMKADPTYFEPALALGLAAIDIKDYSTALDALSQALTVQENSPDARYAFAWVLGKRGYYQDAANELHKLLSTHPREARARLLLGNFYADNLGEPKLAREQYLQALELINPQSSQATLLRTWLDQHP
jgi:tetratricopeptide (TPR) repeat protein